MLPNEIHQRKKTGFNVPIDKWLENNKELDDWRNLAILNKPNTPWARKWAYTVMKSYTHEV